MRIPISEIPAESDLYEIEPGEEYFVFHLKDASGGAARVRRDGDDLVFADPQRSASQQRLRTILGL